VLFSAGPKYLRILTFVFSAILIIVLGVYAFLYASLDVLFGCDLPGLYIIGQGFSKMDHFHNFLKSQKTGVVAADIGLALLGRVGNLLLRVPVLLHFSSHSLLLLVVNFSLYIWTTFSGSRSVLDSDFGLFSGKIDRCNPVAFHLAVPSDAHFPNRP
jgi:hypothetical protein